MPSIDMPMEELRKYKPALYREGDFQTYWDQTIDECRNTKLNAELIPYILPAKGLLAYAVRFDGFKGGWIAGWYVRPDAKGKFPGVVSFHGYDERGQRPLEMLHLAAQGVCVLSMDCRGQSGQSQDNSTGVEGHQMGWMTKGIRDPWAYYYRHVYADAFRALEVLADRDEVDETRIAVTGASQGGGLALAVAALSERPILCLADMPFLCDFRRAVNVAQGGPYLEIVKFLRKYPLLYDDVFRTLSYIDLVNFTPWIQCRTVVSNCLWDDVCPPSTVYGMYNNLTGVKEIDVYPFQQHQTPYDHEEIKYKLLMEMLNP